MCWNNKNGIYPPYKTFEELQEEQGLKHKDWVCEILFLYLINERLSFIGDVRKNKHFYRTNEESLVDRVKNIIPNTRSVPIPEGAF